MKLIGRVIITILGCGIGGLIMWLSILFNPNPNNVWSFCIGGCSFILGSIIFTIFAVVPLSDYYLEKWLGSDD